MSALIRPRSAAGHYTRLLGPDAFAASRLALERDAGTRLRRLSDAVCAAPFGPSRSAADTGMRALVASPGGRVQWRSVPAPILPGPLGAIVRPLAVATCDLDRAMMLGRTPFPLPLHLGHECVAEVIEVGAEVRSVQVGQRVVVPFQISCGACTPCRQGRSGSCTAVPPASMYGFGLAGGLWGGALADRLVVRL